MDSEDIEEVMDEDVEASLEEYIVMVGAGLAGATPHMVSATVMALSRLIFEFHGKSHKFKSRNDLVILRS